MSEIKPGARVRVTFEGKLVDRGNAVDGTVIEAVKGDGNVLEATVPYSATVVELPPAEPQRRGALVEVEHADDVPALYVRQYADDGSDPEPWCNTMKGGVWYSWERVTDGARSVRVLFEGVDDPS